MYPDEFDAVLRRARAGQLDAFDALFVAYQGLLLRYLRVSSSLDAEDIASETWISVIRGVDKFSGDEADFRSWLVTIARNRMIDASRLAARRETTSLEQVADSVGVAPGDSADEALERIGTEQSVALLAALPKDQGEAVFLRYVVGLRSAEVAVIMSRSEGAVRVLAHRGLRALQSRVTEGTSAGRNTSGRPSASRV